MIHIIIKGQPNQRPELAWKQNIYKYFDLYASFGCSFNIYTKAVLSALNLTSSKHSHLIGSLPVKNGEKNLTLCIYILGLFLMLLTQTDEHQMAALTVLAVIFS